jgi:hypothetical protein
LLKAKGEWLGANAVSWFFFVGGGLFEVALFRGNAVLLVNPGVQVKKAAAFGTERTGEVPVPLNVLLTDGTTDLHRK